MHNRMLEELVLMNGLGPTKGESLMRRTRIAVAAAAALGMASMTTGAMAAGHGGGGSGHGGGGHGRTSRQSMDCLCAVSQFSSYLPMSRTSI